MKRITASRQPFDPQESIRHHITVGLAVVVFLAFGVGGWAATTQISGALIAQGSVVVDSNVKKVHHPVVVQFEP